MKLTKKQIIANYAEQHPEGFTPKQMMAATKIKDKNIWVTLSEMKKEGLLSHDPKTRLYKAKTAQVSVPMASWDGENAGKPITKEQLKQLVAEANIKIDREEQATRMLDNMLKEVQETEEKYQDALAVIRYLESKLLTAIQHDARSRS